MSAEERKKQEHVTSPAHIAAAKSATSQRRHQLESNTLASQLNKALQFLKEGPSRTTWIVLGLIVAAAGLYFIWRHFAKSSEEKSSALWILSMRVFEGERVTPATDDNKRGLSSEEELAKLAKNNEGTNQARISRMILAENDMAWGQARLGSNREQALTRVRDSVEMFEKLQSETSDFPALHQMTILRSAKGREMLGEFGKALEHYNLFIKDYSNPASAFLEEAKAGAERLKEGSASRKEQEELNRLLNRKPAL